MRRWGCQRPDLRVLLVLGSLQGIAPLDNERKVLETVADRLSHVVPLAVQPHAVEVGGHLLRTLLLDTNLNEPHPRLPQGLHAVRLGHGVTRCADSEALDVHAVADGFEEHGAELVDVIDASVGPANKLAAFLPLLHLAQAGVRVRHGPGHADVLVPLGRDLALQVLPSHLHSRTAWTSGALVPRVLLLALLALLLQPSLARQHARLRQ
eukprot:scaffold358_cov256-Pinguiococcus_pyrenoidosus.AAC.15